MSIKIAIVTIIVAFNSFGADDGEKYAVVISIANYADAKDYCKINSASQDGKRVVSMLQHQGYQENNIAIFEDKNATFTKISQYLSDVLPNRIKAGDTVLFYFSGHGKMEHHGQMDFGYLVPFDGTTEASTCIKMDELQTYSKMLSLATHQLFILDCCYSGLIIPNTKRGPLPLYTERLLREPSRKILAAGADKELAEFAVNGCSPFTSAFLDAIEKGAADVNPPDGIISFSELESYVKANASTDSSTPRSGCFPSDRMGEFVFESMGVRARGVADNGNIGEPSRIGGIKGHSEDPVDSNDLREAALIRQVLQDLAKSGRSIQQEVVFQNLNMFEQKSPPDLFWVYPPDALSFSIGKTEFNSIISPTSHRNITPGSPASTRFLMGQSLDEHAVRRLFLRWKTILKSQVRDGWDFEEDEHKARLSSTKFLGAIEVLSPICKFPNFSGVDVRFCRAGDAFPSGDLKWFKDEEDQELVSDAILISAPKIDFHISQHASTVTITQNFTNCSDRPIVCKAQYASQVNNNELQNRDSSIVEFILDGYSAHEFSVTLKCDEVWATDVLFYPVQTTHDVRNIELEFKQ